MVIRTMAGKIVQIISTSWAFMVLVYVNFVVIISVMI